MLENIKIFFKKKPLIALGALSLLYTFPVYNKFWAPFDEGIILVACQELLAGKMPYKDFFIVMYPPGQIYVLAFLMKVFSSPIIIGRIYTVFVSSAISILVFYITRLLTKRFLIAIFSWFLVLVSLAPRLGAIPAPIWPGIFLGIFSLYAYMLYLDNQSRTYILATGVLAGLSVLFRHDIGIFLIISILASLFVRLIYKKDTFREIILFIAGFLIIILPCIIYFAQKSAIKDMIDSLILFPFVHEKTAALSFPKPCFNPNMIFHGSLYFIKANQYYIPILVYFFTFIYLLGRFFKGVLAEKENIMLLVVLIFGILTFNQVRIRTDPAHLLTVIQPSVILFGFMLKDTSSAKFNFKIRILLKYAFTGLILFLFILLAVKNVDKYIKNAFRKAYKQDIIETRFAGGNIYLPKEEKDEVANTVRFIRDNTHPKEKIYVGNTVHWKDDFGGSTILYFLSDRLPSTKYYELLPGLVTDQEVQKEIVESLSRDRVNLVVLQDVDFRASDKNKAPKESLILDTFLEKTYRPVKKYGKYNIYKRR